MIGRLAGTLVAKQPPTVLVDAHGVGYEVDVPMSTFYQLPAVGAPVTLHTQLIVREDAHLLFGFGTDAERQAFRQLLKVSGVGARTALSVLSGMTVEELHQAIALQDAVRLTRVPGSAARPPNDFCWSLGTNWRLRVSCQVVRVAAHVKMH